MSRWEATNVLHAMTETKVMLKTEHRRQEQLTEPVIISRRLCKIVIIILSSLQQNIPPNRDRDDQQCGKGTNLGCFLVVLFFHFHFETSRWTEEYASGCLSSSSPILRLPTLHRPFLMGVAHIHTMGLRWHKLCTWIRNGETPQKELKAHPLLIKSHIMRPRLSSPGSRLKMGCRNELWV